MHREFEQTSSQTITVSDPYNTPMVNENGQSLIDNFGFCLPDKRNNKKADHGFRGLLNIQSAYSLKVNLLPIFVKSFVSFSF